MIERFGAAGVPKEKISFVRDMYTFNFPDAPSELVDACGLNRFLVRAGVKYRFHN